MRGAKPTLGYPTRKAAILALSGKGMRPCDIADKIGATRGYVASVISLHGNPTRRTLVRHAPSHWENIQAAAGRRDITPSALVQRLMEIVGADPVLIDNILDDMED